MEDILTLLVFLWVVYMLARFAFSIVEKKVVFYVVFLALAIFPFWDLIMINGLNLDSYTVDVLAEQIVSDVNFVYSEIKTVIENITE